ncbi:MAG TPA: hypothetical protein VF541_13740, partial [Longimicrobium sp.]
MHDGSRVSRRLRRAATVLAAAAAPAAGAAQNCTPPPAVPASYFTVQNGQDWSAVNRFLIDFDVRFPPSASEQDTVVPCPRCGLADLRAWTTQRSNCLTEAAAAQDSLRFVGLVTWSGGSQPGSLGFGPNNLDQRVFLLVKGNQGLALYQNQSYRTQFVHFVAHRQGWGFIFHPDSVHPQPEARWRPDTMLAMHQVRQAVAFEGRGGPAAPEWDGDAVLQTGMSYVWIACAAGCCQFHGTS